MAEEQCNQPEYDSKISGPSHTQRCEIVSIIWWRNQFLFICNVIFSSSLKLEHFGFSFLEHWF